MAKSHEDRVQDEVRRRMVDMAVSAGVDKGRIELEVLFLLPTNFVRQYTELFYMALEDPTAGHGAGKDEGRLKASGAPRDKIRGTSAAQSHSAKAGKKFVAGRWPVRSEAALSAKQTLDRSLNQAVEKAIRAARGQEETVLTQSQGKCSVCGRFQKIDWERCPFHGDQIVP